MNFNGTIIITDPCYIAENKDWGNGFNYDNMTISEEVGFSDNYIWAVSYTHLTLPTTSRV